MKWRKEVSANLLRDMFPKEAFKMETEVNRHELKHLGIKNTIKWRAAYKSATIIIPAIPNHEIRMSPVDKGAEGHSEWMTFSMPQNERSQESEVERRFPEYSLRVFVEVIELGDKTGELNLSQTMTALNMEHLLKGVVHNYKRAKNIEIDPITYGGKH
jgi:hypothetical protein